MGRESGYKAAKRQNCSNKNNNREQIWLKHEWYQRSHHQGWSDSFLNHIVSAKGLCFPPTGLQKVFNSSFGATGASGFNTFSCFSPDLLDSVKRVFPWQQHESEYTAKIKRLNTEEVSHFSWFEKLFQSQAAHYIDRCSFHGPVLIILSTRKSHYESEILYMLSSQAPSPKCLQRECRSWNLSPRPEVEFATI